MRCTTYTEQFKKNAVKKLLMPGSPGINPVARKLGVPVTTLFGWKKKYASTGVMKNIKNKTPQNWTPEQKLQALLETAAMSEQELGAYLRSHGLHSSDLESFKNSFISTQQARGRPKLDPEVAELRKEKKSLERDLKKTQRALAEQSARIILLKKSHEIWGVSEDDE